MKEILFSIIVPVYNVQDYLAECVESIVGSGLDERCELILVDDGSTDRSGSLCDGYAANNIVCIHKENGGLSSARNAGIERARGRYLAFIDSDDYVASRSIASILCELEKGEAVDLYFMQGDKVYPDGRMTAFGDCITSANVQGGKGEVLNYLATQNKFAGSACTKLFRRAFLDEQGIRFPHDRRYGEDLIFVLRCILCAKNYGALDFPYYRYRQQRAGSITNVLSKKLYLDMFLFIRDAAALLTRDERAINIEAERCMSFVAYEYALQVWHYVHIGDDCKKEAKELLDRYRWVMKYAASRRTKVIRLLINALGYSLTAHILSLGKRVLG